MTGNIQDWIWKHSRAKNGARLVLLALASVADEHGVARLRIGDLMQATLLSERSVQTSITELGQLGELAVLYQVGRYGINHYHILSGGIPGACASLMSEKALGTQ